MPATSKKQATAMRMALAARKGDLEVSKLKGAALEIYKSDMTNKEIEDFTVIESLKYYINNMKNLTEYILENSGDVNMQPQTTNELKKTIKVLIKQRGNDADLNDVDVSGIDDMSELFVPHKNFNGDISKWDVSNVKNMTSMFFETHFNGDISKWDVSNVKNMSSMFEGSDFNGDISDWDVSGVVYMNNM